jgi:signal peptidase I
MASQEPEQNSSRLAASEKSRNTPIGEIAGVKDEGDHGSMSFMGVLREWADALVIAFVLAMFIRTYVVELFKIPSGSMSPTLLGDYVAEGAATDSNGEARNYLIIRDRNAPIVQVFRKDTNQHYVYDGRFRESDLTSSQQILLQQNLHLEEHRIFVNKFAYWFKPPARGDIIVFRVPFKLNAEPYERNGAVFPPYSYKRDQSVYVKRAAAFAGEHIQIRPDGHLRINGHVVTDPEIMSLIQYTTTDLTPIYDIEVPEGHMIALGDNSDNSADSRCWGPIPYENLRGKAFLRYWPLSKIRFLNN